MSDFQSRWASPMLDIMFEREVDLGIGSPCARCSVTNNIATYKCFDCFQLRPLCRACIVDAHVHSPFHVIHHWNNGFFTRKTLSQLGLVINLGHYGDACPDAATRTPLDMTVVHERGIHSVRVLRCNCGTYRRAGEDAMKLWRSDLFPASFLEPKTVITRGVLRNFHLLTLTTKVTASGFCTFLQRLTDYWNKESSKDRSREFINAFRQFCYLRNLKRHAQRPPSPGTELGAGSLAIYCPACPQPDINMSPGWETVELALQFLHARYSTRDGNFSLGQKNKNVDHNDLPLSLNAMYFVHVAKYAWVMLEMMDDLIPLGCHDFKALDYRGIKSGIVSHICRHDMIEANGTADLFHGERFRCVDYAMVSSHIRYIGLKVFIEIYDVVCKWWVQFHERLATTPWMVEDFPDLVKSWPLIITGIGKYHSPNHIESCRRVRDIHLKPGMGMFDGDNGERVWAILGKIGTSVQEMGPGQREDTLNEHFSDWNMLKTVELPKFLHSKMENARKERDTQSHYLSDLENDLPKEQLEIWKRDEDEWLRYLARNEEPPASMQSPYQMSKDKAPSQREIHAALRDDEVVKSLDDAIGTGKSVLDLFTVALSIEDQQLKVQRMLRAKKTETTEKEIAELRGVIARRVRAWRSWQSSTFTTLFQQSFVDSLEEDADDGREETIVLNMPSALLGDPTVKDLPEFARLIQIEYQLREAHAREAIRSLRRFIALKTVLVYRRRHVTGQSTMTKSYNSIARVESSIQKWQSIYRYSFEKLQSLGMSMESNLKKLEDADLAELHMEGAHLGYSKDRVSWIWGKHTGDAVAEDDLDSWADETQKVERNLASARAARWTEEVLLLEEEMRRTLRFFRFQVQSWHGRLRTQVAQRCDTGFNAYCARQAAMYAGVLDRSRRLFASWLTTSDIESAADLGDVATWLSDFESQTEA